MHRINCWDDMHQFGIELLTGEACGLSYRLLCDVTQRGKLTIQKALGVENLGLPDNWNRGDPREPDARRYRCESCGANAVYGAEELLIRGIIRFSEEVHDK